jgi:predicted PurR-regulated permease PerM
MNIKLSLGWFYRAAIIALAVWILHSFAQALLAACVTAIASGRSTKRFSARWSPRIGSAGTSLTFTGLIIVFVLVPMIFAFGAMLTETHALLVEVAAADKTGIGAPDWLSSVPLLGPLPECALAARIRAPGALTMWTQRTDPTALLCWAQSLGQFMVRHVFIVAFTILLLFFLYQRGETLADEFRRVLRDCIGQQAERYIDVATRAVRASVNSMLLVALFDGLAAGVVYGITGVPHAALWAAITGALAIVPFLGYVAVGCPRAPNGDEWRRRGRGAVIGDGSVVLICGDKIVRPVIADNGIRLGFVWVLMGCLGGFEALGLVGLVVGPVVISLVKELWRQRVRDVAASDRSGCVSPNPQRALQEEASV